LIEVREEDASFFVRVVSENSQSVIRLEPEALFQLPCFTDVLTPPSRNEFIIHAHALHALTSQTSPDVFSISLTFNMEAVTCLFCAMYLSVESNLIICEFELDRNIINPEHSLDSGLPEEPIHIMDNDVTDNERLLSTTCRSQPLHSLEITRANSRQLTLIYLFQIRSEIQAQLSSSPNLSNLEDVIVGFGS